MKGRLSRRVGATLTPWHHPELLKGQNHPEMEAGSPPSQQGYQPGRWGLGALPEVLYARCAGCPPQAGSWSQGQGGLESRLRPTPQAAEGAAFPTQAEAPYGPARVQLPGLVSGIGVESNKIPESGHVQFHITGVYREASGLAGPMPQRCPQGARSFPSPCADNPDVGFVLGLVTRWQPWLQASRSGDGIQRKKRDRLFHGTLLEVTSLFPEGSWPTPSYISLPRTGSHAPS